MKLITIWNNKNKKGIFTFNHIEDGHVTENKPTPKSINQKSWLNKEWTKEFAQLDTQNVIVKG